MKMKKQTNRILAIFGVIILTALTLSISAFAQKTDATRRLYVEATGFELNEAAAKDALRAGADINWQNDAMSSETMLITAIKGFKDPNVIKFLLDNGADAKLKDDSGKTALDWARQYNIGRNRNGKEILAMLETAAGQTKTAPTANKPAEAKPAAPPVRTTTAVKTAPVRNATRRADDRPSEDEIKTMLEQKFTSIYEDHYCCEKNKVEFDWLAPIQIGGQETRGSIPVSCWGVRVDVKVTFTKQSSGETRSVRRGINGNPVKEGFCVYRDAFDQWTYLTYAP